MSSPSRSGVFQAATDKRLELFSQSISFDVRLYSHDIRGSQAHARMLAKQGLLTQDECQRIVATLDEILLQFDRGEVPLRTELEDVHMHIEQALIERLGDTGRKLHTARSRNDQVATDLRLWTRDALDRVDLLLHNVQKAFLHRCDQDLDVVVPAYTHLQRAQPVLASHYWLAYIEKFARDRTRVQDCRRRLNASPLGAAAVAGTSLPIDRDYTAKELGFDSVAANSIDISSDRDFVVESAFVLSLIAAHLSTWAEEWILWSTVEFGFMKLPHAFCTGSSIMPQKVNPDTLELTRGKSSRVIGNLQTLLVLIKGLPLAYNRDLQEDKPPLFDSFDTIEACLELAAPVIAGAELQRDAIARRLESGHLDATTVMEYFIRKGLPQRTAHHLVGSLVAVANHRGVALKELTDAEIQGISRDLDPGFREVCGADAAVAAYQSYGSSNPDLVRKQIDRWKRELE